MASYSSQAILLMLALSGMAPGQNRHASAFSPASIPVHNGLSTSSGLQSVVAASFRLPSTTAVAEAAGNASEGSSTQQTLDLSQYANLRAFNLALEDIALECSSRKTKNIDVISSATIAEALITKLEIATKEGNAPFEPDAVSYNTLMKAWAKAAQTLADGRGRGDINSVMHAMDDVPEELTHGGVYTAKDAADRALTIMNTLEQKYLRGETQVAPDTFGYNIVLDGLHRCGAKDGAKRVDALYKKMKKWSTEGVPDDDEEYVNADASKWTQIRPDAITYSICMETWGDSRERNALEKIDGLMKAITVDYEKTKDPNVKPVTRVSNSAINAYLRNGYAMARKGGASNKSWLNAKNIHEILNDLDKKFKETGDESYRPDITTITMVIDAYARCSDIAATERGAHLFEYAIKQWKQTGDDKLKPSSRTFTVMISSWAKSRDPSGPQKAEELIERMEAMYAEDVEKGNGSSSAVKPSIRTYTAAMGAWARSRDNTKPQRTLRILKKVNDMYKETRDESIKPNLYTYNIAIDSCARCNGGPEEQATALKIAFAVNKAISVANLEPNHITYSTLLKGAAKLLPPGDQRNEVVKAVFAKCKAKGYVDMNVMKALEQSADRNLYYELMGVAADRNGHVHYDEVPKEWTKNAPVYYNNY